MPNKNHPIGNRSCGIPMGMVFLSFKTICDSQVNVYPEHFYFFIIYSNTMFS